VLFLYKRILFGDKNEQSINTGYKMDEIWKMPITK
jgi:hypothetical protein